MTTKIQLTIEQDQEAGGTDAGMAEVLARLTDLDVLPMKKIALAFECLDGDAGSIRDELAVLLTDRPVGLTVKIKRTVDVERRRMQVVRLPNVTPMDELLRRAVPQVEEDAELQAEEVE